MRGPLGPPGSGSVGRNGGACPPTPQVMPRSHLPFGTSGEEGAGAGSLRQRVPSREESLCHAEEAAQGGRGRQWVEEAGRGTCGEACSCVCPSRDRFVRPSAELAAAALPLAAPCAQRAPAPVPTRPRRRRRCASAGYTSSSSELMCKICCAASSGGSRAAPDNRCGSGGPAPHSLRAVSTRSASCV